MYFCKKSQHALLSDSHEFWWTDNTWAKESFVRFCVWLNLTFQRLDDYYVLAATMRREGNARSQIQKPCFQGRKNQFDSPPTDGNDVFGCNIYLDECSVLAEVCAHWESSTAAPQTARLKGRKTTAFIPHSCENKMLCCWSNASRSQPACHFSLNACGHIFIPSLFSQPLLTVRKLESHWLTPTS